RLNNNQAFTLEEFNHVVAHYNIDTSTLFNPVPVSAEEGEMLNLDCKSFVDKTLESWLNAVLLPFDKTKYKFFLSTNNFPVLLGMDFPDLIKLKIYLSAKTQWLHKGFQHLAFDKDAVIYENVPKYAAKISHLFSQMPSIEVWGNNTLIGFIRQIDKLYKSQLIDQSQCMHFSEQLSLLIKKINKFILTGEKRNYDSNELRTNKPSFVLVYNDTLTIDEYTLISWRENERYNSIVYHATLGFLSDCVQKLKVEQYFLQIQREGYNMALDQNRDLFFDMVNTELERYSALWKNHRIKKGKFPLSYIKSKHF
ncbi:MAG: hypothetical protein AAF573_12675, partial [Bacteroidota bacterium]